MNQFELTLNAPANLGLQSTGIEIVQVNVGFRCNQRCSHCHLRASPDRTEIMDWSTMESIIEAADNIDNPLLDLTGGAPELNPHFTRFVEALRERDYRVQVRTNLTVFSKQGLENMPGFYRDNEVELVASLPCYMEEKVCAQRGEGTYGKSIEGLRMLNSLGYGSEPRLKLNLVYNPGGPFLPPAQSVLEADYRGELDERFGIKFTNLLTITNMPLGRFQDELRRLDREKEYLELLRDSFNPLTANGLMCRRQISIGWDGTIYDCDFNLALGLPTDHGAPNHIRHFDALLLQRRRIVTGEHCFGCTAGRGSSCGGALTWNV